MRNWIIGAAALLAVAVPGVAAAQTGYVDVGYTNSNLDFGGGDFDADTWAANGVVAFDAHALGVQLDGRIASTELDIGSTDIDSWNLGGHVYKRFDNWLVGGYVGFGNVEIGSTDDDEWTVAIEGQYNFTQTTLTGAVSLSEMDDLELETTAVDVGVRHFFNDNLAIDANLGFADVDTGFGDIDATTFGVGGEFQFASMPISVFGGYQHSEVDDLSVDVDSFNIGVRYNWGGTLADRTRSGASLPRRGGFLARLLS